MRQSEAHYGIGKVGNEYASQLGSLYNEMPKAVLAALVVSWLSSGGDHMEGVAGAALYEWWTLYYAGIVPQRPPRPRVSNAI